MPLHRLLGPALAIASLVTAGSIFTPQAVGSVPAGPVAPCEARVLFVAGRAPHPAGDRSLHDAVTSRLGEDCVTDVDDDLVSATQAASHDLVVIASSVRPSTFPAEMFDINVAVIVSEPFLLDEFGLAEPGSGRELTNRTSIYIDDPAHPLAMGQQGWLRVFEQPAALNYARGIDAPVARVGRASSRATLWQEGDRVALFASFDAELTSAGVTLVHNALEALLGVPAVQCGDTIYSDLVLTRDLLDCPATALYVGADDLTIDLNGHTVDGPEPADFVSGNGVTVRGHRGVTIRNGTIRGFSWGVEVQDAHDSMIENIVFSDNVHAVELSRASGNTVRNITSTRSVFAAIRITRSDGNTIQDSTLNDAYWGVLLVHSNNNSIVDNDMDGGSTGFWQGISFEGESRGNLASGNVVRNFRDTGILAVDGAGPNEIVGNDIAFADGDGIQTEPGTTTTITANTSNTNSGWGIYAEGDVTDGGGNTAVHNMLGACFGVICPDSAAPTALVVAGSETPPKGDREMLGRLEQLGVELSIVDDDTDLDGIDPDGYDLVVITSSVVPSKVGNVFAGWPVPLVTWEAYLFDDLGLAAYTESGETSRAYRAVSLAEPWPPIPLPFGDGDVSIQNPAAPLSYATYNTWTSRTSDMTVIAHVRNRPDQAVIMAFHEGDRLANLDTAPALRVGLFATYGSDLTGAGRDLVSDVFAWVLAGGPPTNDDFGDALAARRATNRGWNHGATQEPDEPASDVVGRGASAWWSWTADTDDLVTISTAGSTFDTILTVWVGDDLDTLTLIAENDDRPDDLQSEVTIAPEIGTTYRIAIHGYDDSNGPETGRIALTLDAFGLERLVDGVSGPTAVAMRNGNVPVVAYWDGGPSVAICDDPTCSSVTTTTLHTPIGTAQDIDLAIGPTGNPIVFSSTSRLISTGTSQFTTAFSQQLASCIDPTCTTATVTTIADHGNPGGPNAMALADNGLPFLVYRFEGDIVAVDCDDPECTTSTKSTIADDGDYPDVALRADGRPIISFHARDSDDLAIALCQDKSCAAADIVVFSTPELDGRQTSVTLVDDRPFASSHDFTRDHRALTVCDDSDCTSATAVPLEESGGTRSRTAIATSDTGRVAVVLDDPIRVTECTPDACANVDTTVVAGAVNATAFSLVFEQGETSPTVAFVDDGGLYLARRG